MLNTNTIYNRDGNGSPDFPAGMPTVGGDPIIESGSNSDGNWTRWADGTQHTTAKKNSATEAFATHVHARTFVGTVYMTGNCEQNSSATSFAVKFNNIGTTAYQFAVATPVGLSAVQVSHIAIGRWK